MTISVAIYSQPRPATVFEKQLFAHKEQDFLTCSLRQQTSHASATSDAG